MKRGGQHGVVNWFAQQNRHSTLHLNNCIKGWEQNRLLPMKEHMVVHYRYAGQNHDIKNYFVDHKFDPKNSKELREQFYKADFSDVVDKIYNIEDLTIREFNQRQMWDYEDMGANSKSIIILRDPYNFIASCLQRLVNPPDPGATDVGLELPRRMEDWKEHAKQVLDGTETTQETEFISFNEWFASKDYRESICDNLDLTFTDFGINDVMNFGSGSSFDRQKFDGSAQKMSVLSRYESWKDHSAFKHLVDDEVEYYAKEIFGIKL
tara:strand:+ start:12694 stop:13488 length:795 start_codon:yes stop_codon:yes gene_type:complete